jgi:hypothetical protein
MKNNGTRTVTVFPSKRSVQVAPGITTLPAPQQILSELAIVRWQAMGDGTYRPIIKIYEDFVRVTHAAKILNIDYGTLRRLCTAGFVQSEQPGPHYLKMSLSSWFEHVERTRKDPDFWLNPKNLRRYRDAL